MPSLLADCTRGGSGHAPAAGLTGALQLRLGPVLGSAIPAAAAQYRSDPGQQLARLERLLDEIVGAGIEREDLVLLLGHARDDQDRGVADRPEQLYEIMAAEIGEPEIEQDRRIRLFPKPLDRVEPGRRRVAFETAILERRPEDVDDRRIVFDEKKRKSGQRGLSGKKGGGGLAIPQPADR